MVYLKSNSQISKLAALFKNSVKAEMSFNPL